MNSRVVFKNKPGRIKLKHHMSVGRASLELRREQRKGGFRQARKKHAEYTVIYIGLCVIIRIITTTIMSHRDVPS